MFRPLLMVMSPRNLRMVLRGFGEPLWRTDPRDAVTIQAFGDGATVLVKDRPCDFDVSSFPRLPPSMIWARRLPLQRGGDEG